MSLQRYWARIERIDDASPWMAMEIINFDPVGCFHPSLIWVECTEEVGQDWMYDEATSTFTSPDSLITVQAPLTPTAQIAALQETVDTLLIELLGV